MDNLTHTLMGLALSRAGLNRLTPYATPILLLAANAPDIDTAALLAGPGPYLVYHRHITHAFAALPVMALLPALVVRLFAKKKPFSWKWAYVVSGVGVASNLLLDWLNVYGVRWFLPFSNEWLRGDLAGLADAWVLTALAVAALAPLFSRLVNSEIGARPGSGRGWAIFALCFIALFLGGRRMLHQRAVETLDSHLYEGAAPVRVTALPDSFNPWRWRGVVETAGFYVDVPVNLLREFDPDGGQVFFKPEPNAEQAAAREAASRTPIFRDFLAFSQYPFWRFRPAGDEDRAIRVEAMDLRFGSPLEPGFVAHAVVSPGGRVVESGFAFRPTPRK